ncbi:unnamed protein product, partial [Laminaria digitata]
ALTLITQIIIIITIRTFIYTRSLSDASLSQDSLGGNCNTLLLACIWGEAQHLEETMSTLRLASRMMRVQNETHAVRQT